MSVCANPDNLKNITYEKVIFLNKEEKINSQVSDLKKDNFGSEEANTSSSNHSTNFNNYKDHSSSTDTEEDDLSDWEDFDGDDTLDQQYAFMSQCGNKSKTIKKHAIIGKKNSSKFISKPQKFQIVNGEKFNFKLSNKVDNRFLATGKNFETLKFDFCMGSRTVSSIVKETCQAIWEVLQPLEMKPPSSKERWEEISENFYKKTNFPNCLGAVDGKHLRLISPHRSGSNYYNYKTYFSIVLLAVVDADYRFIGVDVGAYGRESDSNIFNNWIFARKLTENRLNVPSAKALPNTDTPLLPFVFLGDEAFSLNTHFLRPYPRINLNNERRIFNYRLSRARRVVECSFGILSNKWRIFHTSMTIPPDFAVLVTKAACVLHNFVRARDGFNFEDSLTHYFEDNQWRRPQHRSTNQGRNVRDNFAEYFISPAGKIPWQNQRLLIN